MIDNYLGSFSGFKITRTDRHKQSKLLISSSGDSDHIEAIIAMVLIHLSDNYFSVIKESVLTIIDTNFACRRLFLC